MNTKVEAPAKTEVPAQDASEQEPEPTPQREGRLPTLPIARAALPPPNGLPREARAAGMIGSPNLGASGRARMTGALQRSVGNSRVARLARDTIILQAKLTVNEPGDAYEREADGVADRITQSVRPPVPVGRISRMPSSGMPRRVNRQAKKEDAVSAGLDSSMEARIQSPAGGRPLAPDLQREMESGLGTDLSAVRVHDSAHDRADADHLNAKAFTHGNDIWIGSHGSASDHKLMAHELTHVVQQGGAQQVQNVPAVQRGLFGPDLTERQKIDKALASKDPGDVKDIKDVNQATEDEKLSLIRPLAYQGWVGPLDEYKIEEIWRSFGDHVPRIMAKDTLLWNQCIDGGAELDQLASVKKARVRFLSDVQTLALAYMSKNRDYVKGEIKGLGLDDKAPSPQQDEHLKEVQKMAGLVNQAKEKEKQLRGLVVGDEYEMQPDSFPVWLHLRFDPNKAPDRNLSEDEKDKDRDWREVKKVWDPLANFITTVANRYPTIYAALQQSDNYKGGTDKVADIANEKDPAKARAAIGSIMTEMLANIQSSESKIRGGDADYHKFVPLHAQLFANPKASPSGANWSDPFNRWVAENDLATQKEHDFWEDLGLKTAALAAFVVVEFATFGTATFFIAAGLGLAATGYQAYTTVDEYLTLEKLSKSGVKDESSVVDQATVAAAGEKAIAAVANFILMVGTVGAKTLGGLVARDPGKSAANARPSIPEGRAGHIFRDAEGHLLDTPENRELLQGVAGDPASTLGTDRFGNNWSARTLPDGSQVWTQTRNGQIINGGLNQTPRTFNPQTGLSSPTRPGN